MIIVTSGQKWTDIDALACAVAYQELLTLQGKKSVVVLPGELNNSVSNFVKELGFNFETDIPFGVTGYVVVDVSDPAHIASFVDPNKVLSILTIILVLLNSGKISLAKKIPILR